ncbi:hypothetical protein GTA08_BOTSDO05913 [Botryosphaeria dothidea]|uniref:Uncharacterized protein n=1 Tax=Botryosphaeria dothidea TaxID=55169 RepID=A0A8H4ISC0_9PEZI|nr:hypothetical protein GTA08_BOTSDO05913 [Botryosphaeria dothidea]
MPAYVLERISARKDAKVDVVFVQDFVGNRKTSWTKDSILWPQDLLLSDIPDAQIWMAGYEREIEDMGLELLSSTIEEHAEDLCKQLSSEKTPENPVVFVAAGLGGLVCAQIMYDGLMSQEADALSNVVKRVKGLVFLGTPFQTRQQARYTEIVRKIAQTVHTREPDNFQHRRLSHIADSFIGKLKEQSHERRLNISLLCEKQDTVETVISQNEVKLDGYGEPMPIPAGYTNLSKFTDRREEGYQTILSVIKKIARSEKKTEPQTMPANTWNNYNSVKVAQQVAQAIIHGNQIFH